MTQMARTFENCRSIWRDNAYLHPFFVASFILFPLLLEALQLRKPLTFNPDAFV